MYYIGIDVGGTNLVAGLVDENGHIPLLLKHLPQGDIFIRKWHIGILDKHAPPVIHPAGQADAHRLNLAGVQAAHLA